MKTWDDFWKTHRTSKAEKFYIEKRNKEIKKALERIGKKNPRILEAGCGTGSNIRLLKKENKRFALDLSKTALPQVKKEIPGTVQGDIERLPFKENSFDLVFNAGVIEHFESEKKALSEMARVLSKEGLLLVFVPGRFNLWQAYRKLKGKRWVHGYEKNYSVKSLEKAVSSSGAEIVFSGGFDSFTLKGFTLKIFGLRFPFDLDFGFASQEVFVCAKKKVKGRKKGFVELSSY